MKCKYCKYKISLLIWILFHGSCFYCDNWLETLDSSKNQVQSADYWRKK